MERRANVLDMSHHNNGAHIPDFHLIASQGIFAVCHKVTQGRGYVDPTYRQRMTVARNASLIWGGYAFINSDDGVAQAEHFLANAGTCDFYAADYEPNGASTPSMQTLVEFVRHVDDKTGKPCFIYSGNLIKETLTEKSWNANAYKSTAMRAATPEFFVRHPLWLAQYGPKAKIPWPWDRFALWQFTDKGDIAGSTGREDLNFFDGTREQFLELCKTGKVVNAPERPTS